MEANGALINICGEEWNTF